MTVLQPGGRAPAPALLVPVQDFVNTANREVDEDPDDVITMRAWGAARGVIEAAELARLVEIREAVRSWITVGGGMPEALAAALPSLDLRVRGIDGVLRFVSTNPVGTAIAPLVEAIVEARANGTWMRLKTCDRHTCRWVFYDHSKNGGSRWCATGLCGSREKARRARARRLPARVTTGDD